MENTTTSPAASPQTIYSRCLEEHSDQRDRLVRMDGRLAVGRLAVFLGGLVLAWLVVFQAGRSLSWILLPLALFTALVLRHERVVRARQRTERAMAFYERGLDRILHRWQGTGPTGESHFPADHPYGRDLDIVGEGSLFQLLCTARLREGEEILASWLAEGSDPVEVLARQEAVRELGGRLDLRERLALLGSDLRPHQPNQVRLAQWMANPPHPAPLWARIASAMLAAGAALSLVAWAGWGAWGLGPLPLLVVGLVEVGFAAAWKRRIKPILSQVEGPARELEILSQALLCIEKEPLSSTLLQSLQQSLNNPSGAPPSSQIRHLLRLIQLLDARRNQFFLPLSLLLLWGTQIGFAVEAWRAACGNAVSRWLATLGTFEALCALATYHFEHPDDPFPQIVEDGAHFHARGLGHPLLPADRCVRNDLDLDRERSAVLLVSGSNMSGKSTLLRSVGINTVLALAGAPVRADHLQLSPLSVGAAIQVTDSLQRGSSRFYAEILRIRDLLETSRGPTPLLFLLDELLHGTNSHDRRIGGEAVVRGLVRRGGLGLVTTHDLALTDMVDSLGVPARNVHFEDHLEGEEVVFDYLMRPGVVSKSNALALMRSIGLDV